MAETQEQMTRGAQTVWICGTLAVIALAGIAIWTQQPDENDPYDQCRNFLGAEDRECKGRIARDSIHRRYDRDVNYRIEDASGARARIAPDFDQSAEQAADAVGSAAANAGEP